MALLMRAGKSTRDQILDACDRIMARYGFRKMTMEDLAKEAGLSKRTIYLHFEGKEDVGLSSIGRVVEAVQAQLARIAASAIPADEKVREMLMIRVMGRIDAIKHYYHSLDHLFEVVRPEYMARRRTYFEAEVATLAEVLLAGREEGRFAFNDAHEAATTLILATNAFLPYSLSMRELGVPELIRRRLGAMVELLLKGLRNQ